MSSAPYVTHTANVKSHIVIAATFLMVSALKYNTIWISLETIPCGDEANDLQNKVTIEPRNWWVARSNLDSNLRTNE